ncbi:YdcF family protein [Mangrovicoccus algicola]|uniref:YdcF family protein n=1 Tax=Mangrovicoccus algicola TaxID=2771008 RepID=A0A8J6YXJ5_9RHOB|nr:YdcF family protein [Mangrovicoccus algicola]MBE3638284.1 YdcF family protein [Mangrovicoccus algicola]
MAPGRPAASGDGRTAIVILGAAVWPGGRASPALARRIARGADLARQYPQAAVIGSGGLGRDAPAEAHVIRRDLVAAGIDPARILCEDRSTSTLENALFTARLMRAHGLDRVLVVTDSYHCPRAVLSFRRFGMAARARPVWRFGRADRWLRAALREAVALPVYAVRLCHHRTRDGDGPG